MNTSGIVNNAFANAVTPFNPVVKQPVGLENPDAKGEALPPVLEADEAVKLENRENPKDPSGKVEEKDPQQQQEREQQAKKDEQEQKALEEQDMIQQLAARDREVRAHEQAHVAVGGRYAGSPSYTFQRGPDGIDYAVGGEVPITLPALGNDPQETIQIAEQVQRAALAPAEPSPQDRQVAADAAKIALQARADLARQGIENRAEVQQQAEAERLEQEEQARLEQQREEEARREQTLREQQSQAQDEPLFNREALQRTLDNINRINKLANFEQKIQAGTLLNNLA